MEEVAEDGMCWQATSLSDILEHRLYSSSDAKSLILDICSSGERKVASRFALMMKVIWKNKNNLIWHNEKEEATKLGRIVFHNWKEWSMAQGDKESENNHHHITSWNPPLEGWLKCVAWDLGTLSILEAEALALKEAICRAIALHLKNVIFKSDSQQVVQAIHSNHKVIQNVV
ncbi:uncharacterized protein LOC131623301 [Vicia villosa]|uniref:uncharacterized protein LOC131623301 n=1 Tax=Vicia villosa TaxID=3911 RepID=UPI00273B6386|nr:uncharacterized protein LOC131623301 [Vicia villosa]